MAGGGRSRADRWTRAGLALTGRARRPSGGVCAACGEPIFLYLLDADQTRDGKSHRIYVHERTGSIDTETCKIALHPIFGAGDDY